MVTVAEFVAPIPLATSENCNFSDAIVTPVPFVQAVSLIKSGFVATLGVDILALVVVILNGAPNLAPAFPLPPAMAGKGKVEAVAGVFKL